MKPYYRLFIVFIFSVSLYACRTNERDTVTGNNPAQGLHNTATGKSKRLIFVDVRTTEEWQEDGHLPCAVNFPLNTLEARWHELANYDGVWLVCRSGHRAGIAKQLLEEKGLKHVENKGAWEEVSCTDTLQ